MEPAATSVQAQVAGRADLDAVAETIRLAFADDPVWGRTLPRTDDNRELTALWRLWVEGPLAWNWVWQTGSAAAVSVWVPPERAELSPEQEERQARLAVAALGTAGAARLEAVLARFAAAHPRTEPHYYLSLVATHPAHRGRGIGMALLADNLTRIDREGAPAYLESTNPTNNQRYARLGFAPIGGFDLPDGGPHVTTMWRPAARVSPG